MRTSPRVQCALWIVAVAAQSVRPKTLGTLQGMLPLVELVVKVSVAWAVPLVTVAVAADGVLDAMTLVVPRHRRWE